MLNKTRIKAMSLRHLYPLRRDFDLLSDMVYWPIIDTLLWGITGTWLGQSSGIPGLVTALLMGLVLWNIVWRSQSEVGRNMMDEIWNSNLLNIFASPLTVGEWLVSVLGLSFIKTAVTLAVIVPVMIFAYNFNLIQFGVWLAVFYVLATMTGWWIGLIASAVVLRWGPKVQTVIWTLPGFILPLSAVYFPVDQLPVLLQKVALLIPTTYVFEAMRSMVYDGVIDPTGLVISLILNLIYLTLAGIFFVKSFAYSKRLGLHRFL